MNLRPSDILDYVRSCVKSKQTKICCFNRGFCSGGRGERDYFKESHSRLIAGFLIKHPSPSSSAGSLKTGSSPRNSLPTPRLRAFSCPRLPLCYSYNQTEFLNIQIGKASWSHCQQTPPHHCYSVPSLPAVPQPARSM